MSLPNQTRNKNIEFNTLKTPNILSKTQMSINQVNKGG